MYNVCAHHAAIVEDATAGVKKVFKCPYHGWCYRNDGRLIRSVKLQGIKNFKAKQHGLKKIQVYYAAPGFKKGDS